MNTMYQFSHKTLRAGSDDPVRLVSERFPGLCKDRTGIDALFLDAAGSRVIGWCGLVPRRPILREALNEPVFLSFLREALSNSADGLITDGDNGPRFFRCVGGSVQEVPMPVPVCKSLSKLRHASDRWVGSLTDEGDYVFDPRTPSPGTISVPTFSSGIALDSLMP